MRPMRQDREVAAARSSVLHAGCIQADGGLSAAMAMPFGGLHLLSVKRFQQQQVAALERAADSAGGSISAGLQWKSSSRWWRAPMTRTNSGVRISKRRTYPVEPNGTMSSRSVGR